MGEVGLSDGEWKIMRILWKHSPCTITQLVTLLYQDTGWSKHTVITMLGRMVKKGAVRYEEGIKAKQFYPVLNQSEITVEETTGFLKKVYDGSVSMMVNAMLGSKSISRKEIEDLYDLLKKAEKEEE